jgi:hypothetical protein
MAERRCEAVRTRAVRRSPRMASGERPASRDVVTPGLVDCIVPLHNAADGMNDARGERSRAG